MNFICICMSPAIDASVGLTTAPRGEGEIFKDVRIAENVGGKAINVARWLAIRRRETGGAAKIICRGLLGAENSDAFVREFGRFGIVDEMTRVAGMTRRNEMITWPGGSFKLNQTAFGALGADDMPALSAVIGEDSIASGDMVILSGSLPGGCGVDFYARAVAACKARGALVVLDASGEAMKRALASEPDLIKPNAEECEALIGYVPRTAAEFARATADLKALGARQVIVSDGAAGAYFNGEFVASPRVKVVDTTAAGDTLLAEYCFSRDARRSVAAGAAAVEMPGSMPPSMLRINDIMLM